MTQTNAPTHFIPFVPISVSSAILAAAPLVKALAAQDAGLSQLTDEQFQARLHALESSAAIYQDSASQAQARIALQLDLVDGLFASLQTQWLADGQHQQMLREAGSSSHDIDTLAALLTNLAHRADLADKNARSMAAALVLPEALYQGDVPLAVDKLFQACLARLEASHQEWQDALLPQLVREREVQTFRVYAAVMEAVQGVCSLGLENLIAFEDTPQELEDVLVALEIAQERPFSGDWPVGQAFADTSTSASTAASATPSPSQTNQGEGA